MHLHARRLARITVSAVLAVGLALGSTSVANPAQAEPVGVPVPAFQGGTATGWGSDNNAEATAPASLAGKTVRAIAAGRDHSLALTSDGQVTAWGSNSFGQVDLPAGLTGKTVTAIASSHYHCLALTSDGTVTAWGRNTEGQLFVPASLAGRTVTAVAAGRGHSLALTSDGTVTGWGSNADGQSTVPAGLIGKTVTAIAAGREHSLALTSDGTVTGWGSNADGQSTVPASLTGKTVTAIAAGALHSLALTSDGSVTAWGSTAFGLDTVPAGLAGKTVTAVAAGVDHSVALTGQGTVIGWGADEDGQSSTPAGLAGRVVTAIAAGGGHSLAIATDFAAEGTPMVAGETTLGGTLAAAPGRYTAQPDSIGYQWYADGATIDGATTSTLALAAAQVGKRITVRVTAGLTGHAPVVTASNPRGPVVGVPAVRLAATKTRLRRGQATTLTWTSTAATALIASGAWSGARAAVGTLEIRPTRIGVTTYALTATNAHGTTTAMAQVQVTRPARRLKVAAPKGEHRAGSKLKVSVRGLEARETYTIRIGKKKVATGTAKNTRPLVRKIPLPRTSGRATIRVSGDQPDRTGTTKVRVVRR